MQLKGLYSTFKFRPPGVLKSSVFTSPRPRLAPVPAFHDQKMEQLSLGINPNASHPLGLLKEIPPGMIFFCSLDNAYFVIKDGIDGLLITEDHHIIQESQYFCDKDIITGADLPPLQTNTELDEVFISFDNKWMEYDHWMGYTLSKAFLTNPYIPSSIKMIIPSYREHTSMNNPISKELYDESLKKTNLAKRVTQLPDGVYKAKKINYMWSNSYFPEDYFNFNDAGVVFDSLTKKFKYNEELPARFFISPPEKFYHTIGNEQKDILHNTLQALNIVTVDITKMDLTTQLELFSQAELIVSTHRCELINLFTCKPDTEVLELTFSQEKDTIPSWPYIICSSNRIQYSFIDLNSTKLTTNLINDAIYQLDAL